MRDRCRWPHAPSKPPPWWPTGEQWPPAGRPPWVVWRQMRGRFLRRIGLLLGTLFLFSIGAFTLLIWLVGAAPRFAHPHRGGHVFPWGGLTLMGLVVATLIIARALRHAASPAADVMEAAGQLSEGNYAVRVIERGPPEVKRLARAFNRMASRVQAQDEQRRNLLADVAHELRTPLAVIQGNVEGLLDGVYPRDDVHLARVLDETRLLSALIEDLRTLALAETGALELHRELTELPALIQDTATALRPKAEAAGIALEVDCESEVPPLELDPIRIRQVVANLLMNALQHTNPGGGVNVRWELHRTGDRADSIVVSVSDTGRGIAPADLPHIFERFYKSTESHGSGLGLPIARHLIAMHGGGISADSELGRGTTVRFTLPLTASP
jgi:signal transduction histidine kinase